MTPQCFVSADERKSFGVTAYTASKAHTESLEWTLANLAAGISVVVRRHDSSDARFAMF